jgi:hypothetical protein
MHPGSTTALRGYSFAIARFAVAEPVESDQDARSTCTQRDPRRRHVRRFVGQGTDAERRATSMICWWRSDHGGGASSQLRSMGWGYPVFY